MNNFYLPDCRVCFTSVAIRQQACQPAVVFRSDRVVWIKRYVIYAYLCLSCIVASASWAQSLVPDKGVDVGFALASPSVGVSVRSLLRERRSVALVLGNGVQFQINFKRDDSVGGYYFLGVGRDDIVSLIRGGYGYRWQPNRFSFHIEAGLNLPVWSRRLDGFADLGRLAYFFPFGFGVHYRF